MESPRAAEQRAEMKRAIDAKLQAMPPPQRIEPTDAFSGASVSAAARLLTKGGGPACGDQGAAIKKVLIGRVPDRGGRAYETFFGTETFSQQAKQHMTQQRSGKGGGKGGGGGSKGTGRGGNGGGGGGGGGGGKNEK